MHKKVKGIGSQFVGNFGIYGFICSFKRWELHMLFVYIGFGKGFLNGCNDHYLIYYYQMSLNFEICVYLLYISRNLNSSNVNKQGGEYYHHLRAMSKNIPNMFPLTSHQR